MTKIFTRMFFLSFFILTASSIYSQGILRGAVSDSLSHDPLIGANVQLIGTAFGNAVDIEGVYRILNISAGQYRVKVSYVGYKTKELNVSIKNGETVTLNVQLVSAVIQGKEIIVSAQALGQAAAINQQLSANTIINVVSEEKIQELPDANAAEAIGRLPGVSILRSGGEANKVVLRGLSDKFSTVTIDGVRMAPTDANERGVDLSTIAQGSLAGIELFKALTPDKDADAIAGGVNLVTRKAPSTRVLRFEPKGNYNAMDKSANQYNFTGRYGERFFDDILGVQLTGNLERVIRSNESTDLNYDNTINNSTDYYISQLQITYVNEIRKRWGASLLLDFNTPDNGSIKISNVYNETARSWLTSYRFYPRNGNVEYHYRDQERNIITFNSSIHGLNYLLGFQANWNISFSQSSAETPFDYQMRFDEPSQLDPVTKLPLSGMLNVPPEYNKGPVEKWIPYALNNFKQSTAYDAVDQVSKNFDKERGAFLDLLKKYAISEDVTGELKFGGKFKSKSRYNSADESGTRYYLDKWRKYVKSDDGTVGLKNVTGTPFDYLYTSTSGKILFSSFLNSPPEDRSIYGLYNLYPLVNRDVLRLWRQINIRGVANANGTDPEYTNDLEMVGGNYALTERVYAGYLMNTLNLGREISFIAGVRIESDDNDYAAKYTPAVVSGAPFPWIGTLKDTSAVHKETSILPNFHITYRPFDFWNVRVAAYKALARPDFNQRLPKYIATSASGNIFEIGNPNLKNAVAWNFELQNQFYNNDIGLFTISAFYKDIKDMYHIIDGVKMNGRQVLDSLGVGLTQPFPFGTSFYNFSWQYNSSRPTRVWGIEVEHQANFRFLPGLLKNLILNYNFTLVRSETWITSSKVVSFDRVIQGPFGPITIRDSKTVLFEKMQKLEDQPEFFGNVSLGYDYEGFSFRISLFYQGQYNSSFSADQRGDLVQESFTKVDLVLKQKVTDNISVSLNLNNITNTQTGSLIANRIQGWLLNNSNNRYGLTGDLGVRIDL